MYKLIDNLIGEEITSSSLPKLIKEAKRRIEYYKVGYQGRWGKVDYYPFATYTIKDNVIIIN